jgi:glutamate-ammonia-ligase adenylyltransferase
MNEHPVKPIAENNQWLDWLDSHPECCQLDSSLLQQGNEVFRHSLYVQQEALRKPELLTHLLTSGVLVEAFNIGSDENDYLCPDLSATETDFSRQLRLFRRYHMIWIYWRDLAGEASLQETCAHVSWLADQCVHLALSWAHNDLARQFQISADDMLPLIVMAMGKYGAQELNVSSDIDLIFCYSDEQQAPAQLRSVEHFYTRIGQKVIQLLDQRTADGFVFRVDMRLRPYGDSGALVMSQSAMEAYYLEQGRDWERFALIKARFVTGTEQQRKNLHDVLLPFVFRRYVDFSVLESPREMKRLIQRELRRRNLGDNIKLGAGGIREIEFIAQALQLIHGGKDPELQCRRLLDVLPRLVNARLLDGYTVQQLNDAYFFLRRLEHRIQAYKDEQTQVLPNEMSQRDRLAQAMGYPDWSACGQVMDTYRGQVHKIFSELFSTEEHESHAEDDHFLDLWLSAKSGEDLGAEELDYLAEIKVELQHFAQLGQVHNMGPRGEQALNSLMPAILARLGNYPPVKRTFLRILTLINAIITRTAYLQLLVENTDALEQMITLCAKSELIADYLANYPYVLDELLNPAMLLNPGTANDFNDLLRQNLNRIPVDDLERRMDVLREVRQTQLLRLAAADVAGVLDVDSLGMNLTEIANIVLRETAVMAWQQLAERHGIPESVVDNSAQVTPGFSVIAYGKVGGREMGYSSDLDLVFLYQAVQGTTNGEKPIDAKSFYIRLAQKMIHLLNTRTRTGVLYEVDMRLRPSGNSGLLVTEIEAFRQYQQSEAWTWEHQALIRARPMAGDPEVAGVFQQIRQEILCQPRDHLALKEDVSKMRERMREHTIARGKENELDLKQSPGGLADIEFMIQYWVLRYAHSHPELAAQNKMSDLMRSLGQLPELHEIPFDMLAKHFSQLREHINQLSLQKLKGLLVPDPGLAENFLQVQQLWQAVFDHADG